jgi:hypothetical protein
VSVLLLLLLLLLPQQQHIEDCICTAEQCSVLLYLIAADFLFEARNPSDAEQFTANTVLAGG